jgi:hypothetical protein
MPDLIPDMSLVRAFLRQRCPMDLVDRLELTYLKVKSDGRGGRFLYEARGAHNLALRVSAHHVRPETGRKLESPSEAGGAPPALYSPDLQLLFQIFPADRRLESLGTVTDRHAMAPVLQAALRGDAHRTTVREVAVHVVRYKPERKCVLRYDIQWTVDTGLPSVVYAKVVWPKQLARTPRLLTWIRESAGGLVFDFPEPLGILPRLGTELYSQVPGTPLSALCEADEFPLVCRRVGRALRQFHGLRVAAAPRRNVEAKIAQLEGNAGELLLLLPSDETRIKRLRHQLAMRLQMAPSLRSCLIHGDFHGDNVLVERGRVGLVDLDDCALGNPAEDLGSMWAQLRWLSIKGTRRPQPLARGRQAFLDGYLENGAEETTASAPLQAALHCFLFAYQCLRHAAAPARRDQAQALLAACEKVLEKGLP